MYLKAFKTPFLDPIPKDSVLIDLGLGVDILIFKSSPSAQNAQPGLKLLH